MRGWLSWRRKEADAGGSSGITLHGTDPLLLAPPGDLEAACPVTQKTAAGLQGASPSSFTPPPPRMANAGGGKSHSLAWMSDICLVVPRPFFHYQIKGNKRQFLVPTPNASQKYNFSICALKSVGLVFLSHGLAAKWQLFGFLNNDSLL